MTMSRGIFMGAAALIALGGALSSAQTAPAGVYTAAQASAGRGVYTQNCAGCHRSNLAGGGDAPALGGKGFMSSFGGKSTKDLFKFIATSMPAGAPASLSETQYTTVTAYLLAMNGAAAGTTPFSKNAGVRISA